MTSGVEPASGAPREGVAPGALAAFANRLAKNGRRRRSRCPLSRSPSGRAAGAAAAFALDPALAADPAVSDISVQTLPADFRDRRVHHAYRIDG